MSLVLFLLFLLQPCMVSICMGMLGNKGARGASMSMATAWRYTFVRLCNLSLALCSDWSAACEAD